MDLLAKDYTPLPLQRDEFLRQQYISDVSVYSPEMLVFIDETGTDRRNGLRKYGYSLRGKPLTLWLPRFVNIILVCELTSSNLNYYCLLLGPTAL